MINEKNQKYIISFKIYAKHFETISQNKGKTSHNAQW